MRLERLPPDERPRDCAAVGAELAQLTDVLDGWAVPQRSTLASARDATMRSAPGPGFLTRSEQRLVSLVLAGDPDDVETSVAESGGVPSASDITSALQEISGEGPASSAVPTSAGTRTSSSTRRRSAARSGWRSTAPSCSSSS